MLNLLLMISRYEWVKIVNVPHVCRFLYILISPLWILYLIM